jgi:hypothetical protein
MENEILNWINLKSDLMGGALSKNPYFRHYVRHHPDATEEIILTAKAMDFIEDVEKT